VEAGDVTHSTYLYVVDPAGNVRETFLPDAERNSIASDVRLFLQGQ